MVRSARRHALRATMGVLAATFVASLALRADEPAPAPTEAAKAAKTAKTAAEAPPALVIASRLAVLEENELFPCSDCHDPDMLESDPAPRVLTEEHGDLKLVHGGERFWCLTCHHSDDRDKLTNLKGAPLSFDESPLLCGQCHYQQQREFVHGAHGKRLENWRGERKVIACTGCHNPHAPAIAPRRPWRPERVREGLATPHTPTGHPRRVWEKVSHDDEK